MDGTSSDFVHRGSDLRKYEYSSIKAYRVVGGLFDKKLNSVVDGWNIQ